MTRLRYSISIANHTRYLHRLWTGTSVSLDRMTARIPELLKAGFDHGPGVRECLVRVTYGPYGAELMRVHMYRHDYEALNRERAA